MNNITENPYQTPAAELTTKGAGHGIMEFKRFSAWGVFGLTLISFGVYSIYWLYTRALVVNDVHEKKISNGLLYSSVMVTVLSLFSGFLGETEVEVIASLIITLLYMVVILTLLFKVRNRLQDIARDAGGDSVKLSPVLTFFLSTIYLQFKINQSIDKLVAQ